MASALFGLLVLNALLAVAGSGILVSARWCDVRGLTRFVGLGYVAGWAYAGVVGSIALAAGLSWSRSEFVVAAAAPWLFYALRRGRQPRLPEAAAAQRPYNWMSVAALAIAAASVIRSVWQPLTAWDAWDFWTPKSESIVYFGGLSKAFFHSGVPNADYPPLVPAIESLAFRFMHSFDTTLVHVQFSLLLVAFVAALAELTAMRPAARTGGAMLVLIAAAPTVILQTLDAYADVPLAVFVSLAAIALWSSTFEKINGAKVLGVLFLAAALATKVEGALFAAVMVTVLLALSARRHRPRRELLIMATAAATLSVVPWRLWLAFHDVHAGHAFTASNLTAKPERFGSALDALVVNSVNPKDWLFLPLVCLVVVGYGLRDRRTRSIALFATASVCLMILGLDLIYWATAYPFQWYLDTSASRVITAPVLLLATLAAWQLSSSTDGDRRFLDLPSTVPEASR